MRREQLPPHATGTFVLPRWKTVYVSVPKAACTSLKWLVADLQEEDPQKFYGILSRETGRQMTLHARNWWKKTPTLHELDDDRLAEIDLDDGWFVFAVVRHPTARLWSAWQSKFLLREPRFLEKYPGAPWPRLPKTSQDVADDFATFVRSLDATDRPSVLRDRHFLTQDRLLGPDDALYSRIYRTDEIGPLLRDLSGHLAAQGLATMPALRSNNETPLALLRDQLTPDMVQTIGHYFAADFRRFGYADVVPPTGPALTWTPDQLAEIGRLVDRNERIGDLYDMAVGFRDAEKVLRAQLKSSKHELRRTRAELREAQRGLGSRLRDGLGRTLRRG